MERLIHHEWRGNVRELRNVVERAIILFPNMQINADQVDTLLRRRNSNAPTTQLVREPGRSSPSCPLNGRGIDLKQHLAEIERQYIVAALAQEDGDIAAAQRIHHTQHTTFIEK